MARGRKLILPRTRRKGRRRSERPDISRPPCCVQEDASRITQAQLASTCQRTSSWLRAPIAHSSGRSTLIKDLTPLISCSRLTTLDLSDHRWIKDLTPLSTLNFLRELRLRMCWSIYSLEPLSP
jgi:hypothetical protein